MGNCYKNPSNEDAETEIKNARANNNVPQADSVFISDSLKAHNAYRKKHGVEPLTINPDLCFYSQEWADYLASNNVFDHSNCEWNGNVVGENIAMCSGQEMTGKFITDMWYNEINDYDFKAPGFTGGTGHFTQVVWKGSKQLGIGVAKAKDGTYYGVANYYPPGNDVDSFPENVFPVRK